MLNLTPPQPYIDRHNLLKVCDDVVTFKGFATNSFKYLGGIKHQLFTNATTHAIKVFFSRGMFLVENSILEPVEHVWVAVKEFALGYCQFAAKTYLYYRQDGSQAIGIKPIDSIKDKAIWYIRHLSYMGMLLFDERFTSHALIDESKKSIAQFKFYLKDFSQHIDFRLLEDILFYVEGGIHYSLSLLRPKKKRKKKVKKRGLGFAA